MRVIVLIVMLCSGLTLSAQKKEVKPIENLRYTVYYNIIFNMAAGFIDITVAPSDKYPNAQYLFATGGTGSFLDTFFKVRDTLFSYHDSLTFLPYEFSRKAHEGNYHKTFDYVWNYKEGAIYADIHRIGRYQRRDTIPLQPNTFDILSVAWYARNIDFDACKKNELIPIRVLVDQEIYDLHVRYLGEEKIKVNGKKQECYIFSPLMVPGEVFKDGENMKMWVSKDEYRVPLQMEAKILVGSIKAVLSRVR